MNKNGFTFIELLVVITIIGVLASIGMVSYSGANKKSRDGKRKADIEQIRAALEMYRTDSSTGVYPANLSDLTPTYINSIPVPPPNSKTIGGADMSNYQDGFICNSPFTTYSLCLKLEVDDSDYCGYNP